MPLYEECIDAPAMDYLCLEVKDTGCGLEQELQDRVFDPFFSTKEFGRGMGLAIVLGIIQSHNGFIDFKARKGEGATVSLYLPM